MQLTEESFDKTASATKSVPLKASAVLALPLKRRELRQPFINANDPSTDSSPTLESCKTAASLVNVVDIAFTERRKPHAINFIATSWRSFY